MVTNVAVQSVPSPSGLPEIFTDEQGRWQENRRVPARSRDGLPNEDQEDEEDRGVDGALHSAASVPSSEALESRGDFGGVLGEFHAVDVSRPSKRNGKLLTDASGIR